MKQLSLTGVRSALIVAPHSDDETIGAFGLIHALRLGAARVRIIVVTDGAASHPNSVCWPRRQLVAERRRETLAAMRRIGVSAGGVTFLGLPDGQLWGRAATMSPVIRRAVARANRIDLLVLPACDDDHPDHRIVSAALRRSGARQLHYLVWPSRQGVSRRASHSLRLGNRAAAKRGAIRRYRSQMGAITDDPAGFSISRSELITFARPVELFREVRR